MRILLYILPIAIQAMLIIHVVKTGRDRFWIYILLFLPGAGGIAYVVVEIVPSLLAGRTAHTAQAAIARMVNPTKRLRELEDQVEILPSFQNKKLLGDEYLRNSLPDKAVAMYRSCLQGHFAQDPDAMHCLARAYMQTGDYSEANKILEDILKAQTGRPNPPVQLCHAEVLERLGKTEQACQVYEQVSREQGSVESLYHFASFLVRCGRISEANQQFHQLFLYYDRLPRFSKKLNRRWIQSAKEELKQLSGRQQA